MATAIPFPGWQTGDANGTPESGGKIFFYVVGTTTPIITYSDTALTTPNANPVVMDASGWVAPIYISSDTAYDYIVKSSDEATTLKSRTTVPSNVSGAQPVDATLTAIAGLVVASGDIIRATGVDTFEAVQDSIADYTELKSLSASSLSEVQIVRSSRGGTFLGISADYSSILVLATKAVSAVDAGADTLTATAHGFQTCQGVLASSADAGLSLNTIYYVGYIDANTVRLHATQKDAVNDTSRINITALGGSLSLKSLRDPGEVIHVIPDGAEKDGSEGCFVRQYDKVSVTTLWGGALVDGSTDDFEALQHTEMFIRTTGAQMFWPFGTARTTAGLIKSNATVWRGIGSNLSAGGLGSVLSTAFNGSAVTLLGDGVNRRGWIDSIRVVNSDNATYTTADGVVTSGDVRDHILKDSYVLNYRDCYADRVGGKAHYIERCYLTGASRYAIHLKDNTDSWISETQADGDSYGIFAEDCAALQINVSRPQVSGTANILIQGGGFNKVLGGFSDTAINADAPATGSGLILRDTLNPTVNGLTLYSNGHGASHIVLEAQDGETLSDVIISNCIAIESPSNTGTTTALEFKVGGTGIIRRVTVTGNNFQGCDQSVLFPASIGTASVTNIVIDDSNILASGAAAIVNTGGVTSGIYYRSGVGRLAQTAYASRATDVALTAFDIGTHKFTGTQGTSINVDLPTVGNYAGKRLRIKRDSVGSATITVRCNSGGTTLATLYGAGAWVDVEATGTGVTWEVVARGGADWATGIAISTTPQTILAAGVEAKAWRVTAMRSSGDADVDFAEWIVVGDSSAPVISQISDIISGSDRALALSLSGTNIQLAATSAFTGQYKIVEI